MNKPMDYIKGMDEVRKNAIAHPRPDYETPEHLKAEYAYRDDIVKTNKYGNYAQKLSALVYNIDYAFFGGGLTPNGSNKLTCFMEIKCRPKIASTSWPTYMISLHKWKHGLAWSEFCNVPFYLAVRFNDGIDMIAKARMGEDIVCGWGGRTDRNDPKDMEPVVFVPMSYFEILNGEIVGKESEWWTT